jgi:hypothetical protein
MRKALCIGINYYASGNNLKGCVNDALDMERALEFNYDDNRNFQTKHLIAYSEDTAIDDLTLQASIDELFEGDPEIALLYFSGHGSFEGNHGYLCPSNFGNRHTGVSMEGLIRSAADSKAKYKVIILDCCHSGDAGNAYFNTRIAELPENTVILAGCAKDGFSVEAGGFGVFTSLILEALSGLAADYLGEVSPASIYTYVDKCFGAFEQRPVFKANIKGSICLKRNQPPIPLADLRQLAVYFRDPDEVFPLDPTYEEDKNNTDNQEINKEHEAIMVKLRRYNTLGLIAPYKEKYMYWAAVNSTGCRLTDLGKYYWRLTKKKII